MDLMYARELQAAFNAGDDGNRLVAAASARAAAAHNQELLSDSQGGASSSSEEEEVLTPVVRRRADEVSSGQFVRTTLEDSVYRSCISRPSMPRGAVVASLNCVEVKIPFDLGTVMGRSSTVQYDGTAERQLRTVAGFGTQGYADQTTFFPNYWLVKSFTSQLMDNLPEPAASRQYRALLESRPWDDMWRMRVKHFFFINPATLSAEQATWLEDLLTFQFCWREGFWVLGHWLTLSRQSLRSGSAMRQFYASRQNLVERLRKEWAARAVKPAGMTDLIWSEPAVWYVPKRECHWAVEDITETPLFDQQRALDVLEPIRTQWIATPGRSVEGLLPEQIDMLPANGRCWELPDYSAASVAVFTRAKFPDGLPHPERYTAGLPARSAPSAQGEHI